MADQQPFDRLQATVNYTEPDGDKEKLTFMLRDAKWKAVLAIPK